MSRAMSLVLRRPALASAVRRQVFPSPHSASHAYLHT